MTMRLIFTTWLGIGCLATPARPGNLVWLETERFADYGGWTNDSQFIDQMGSPYLMAIGLGEPVEDAVHSLILPKPGRYRLWARANDWVSEHHPGRFQILIDGKPIDHVFGQSGRAGWRWEDGGLHELSRRVELRLGDLTGFYGRCDVIVLSDDLDWTPPDDQQAITELRVRFGGLSPEVQDIGEYDVVVIGGGLAGTMAAVSSARTGARTALIQNRPVLGGNASVEILVPPVGVWPYGKQDPLDPRETGLVEEIRGRGVQTTDEAKPYSARLMRLVRAEPSLDLYLNTHATGVEMSSAGTIAAVTAVDVRSGRRMRFAGRVFIDCTGDASVGVAAGAEYCHGREPRSMYHESMAPEVGDRKTMGNSLMYASQPGDSPQPFDSLPWAMEFPRCDSFPPGRHPRLTRDFAWQWKLELGGTRDTCRDAEEIRDDLLRLVFGMWDHVKNHCDELGPKAANHRLVWVGHVAGKRESRRLVGEYVLTQNDIAGQTLFPDRVAYGGWGVDDHYPAGFFHDGPPAQHDYKGVLHSIPYRSLYSRNVSNLLMAGRNISASHVAMSATRVMLTCAVMGQASGTAAAMCIEHETLPRGIYQDHIEELQQQLLKDGAYLIDLPNRDPRDLARSAKASASSQRIRGDETMVAEHAINGYARAAGGKTNAWGPTLLESGPPWIQLSWDQPQSFNVVHVTFLTKDHAAERFTVEAWQDGGWKTLAKVSNNRRRRHVLAFNRVTSPTLRVVLLAVRSPEVGVCEIRVYDEPDRVVDIAKRVARNMNLPDPQPDLPWDDSVLWVTGVDPKKLAGLVIDESRAETAGAWVRSDYTGPYVGDGYLHDGNADKGAKSIRFTLSLPKQGSYEVRLAYTAFANRATNTPVVIRTSKQSKTVRINQRLTPPIDGLFMSLGTFDLDAGSQTTIEISNAGTDGYVVVDAVQLIPTGDP